MATTSIQENPREIYRYQRLRCLRCADLDHDRRSLARYHHPGPDRRSLGPAALRLASGAVRVCGLYHRSIVLHPDLMPSEFVMTVTEVTSRRDEGANAPYTEAPS